ncbi:MAG TPA: M12 family metallopeptidase [Spirochaetota bacterium]|nr:M12 family metallopeptidase [Spirochaetota bacterium]HPI89762.1 M12 family metallopeptidase [Spirochaetota bacterium]HPR47591.1 M12 family metallopeptidase [Spirochaetota bacterium]
MFKNAFSLFFLFIIISISSCEYDSEVGFLLKSKKYSSQVIAVEKWPENTIPYHYADEFASYEKNAIKYCMKVWQKACGITFTEVNDTDTTPEDETVVLSIYKAEDDAETAESTVGYVSDPFMLIRGSRYRTILHELGHVLGLLHEHQRPDRDNYITINWANIQAAYISNYVILDSTLIEEENYDYDYFSIMHYSAYAGGTDFDAHTYDIIDEESVPDPDKFMLYLTALDVEKTQDIYGPPIL